MNIALFIADHPECGFVRADGQYVGNSYRDFDSSDPATFQHGYTLLDVVAGIVHTAWEANLLLNNALGKQAARSRIFTNRPRTAGVSLRWKF